MPRLYALILLIAVLGGCTRPIASDFQGRDPGLADDELLWVQRVPASPGIFPWESGGELPDSLRIRMYNEPLFTEVMPVLLRDLLDGKLSAYEDFEISGEQKEIPNLQEKLAKLGVKNGDLNPFLHELDLLRIVKTGGAYSSRAEYLRVVWRDPQGKSPEKSFANVSFSQLDTMQYTLTVSGQKQPLTDYIRRERYHFYPVYVRSNRVDYLIASSKEADFLKESILAGDWNSVQWIEGRMNVSGKTWVQVSASELNLISGVYEFDPLKRGEEKRYLFLQPDEHSLVADWSNRFQTEKIFPWTEGGYFTPGGEQYDFYQGENEGDIRAEVIAGEDTIRGNKMKE